MERKSLKQVLMERDGYSEEEADERIEEAKDDVNYIMRNRQMPLLELEEYLQEEFGLEPDFLEDLIEDEY